MLVADQWGAMTESVCPCASSGNDTERTGSRAVCARDDTVIYTKEQDENSVAKRIQRSGCIPYTPLMRSNDISQARILTIPTCPPYNALFHHFLPSPLVFADGCKDATERSTTMGPDFCLGADARVRSWAETRGSRSVRRGVGV